MSVKGKGARDKGSRAERKVRDMLKTIYPSELRKNVQRVPMSGAGWMKGDVLDRNDTDSCYEVKNQEKLCMPDWWRQTISQSGTSRTPVLVVTQSYRPYYFIMRKTDWDAMRDYTEYKEFNEEIKVKSGSTFFDDMADIGERQVGRLNLVDDDCVVISSSYYIDVKTSIYNK